MMRFPTIRPNRNDNLYIDEHGRLVAVAGNRMMSFEAQPAWFREAGQMLLRHATMMELGAVASATTIATLEVDDVSRGRRD